MPTRMTPEELMEHAQKCFTMSQYAISIGNFNVSKLWHKAAKRAEHRADCIWSGKGDPAFGKSADNH